MREIKFRGKRLDNNEWVYGHYFHKSEITEKGFYNKHIICYMDEHSTMQYVEVNPETVGQYTNFNDKNDKEIYEKAKIKYYNEDGTSALCIVKWDENNGCYRAMFNENAGYKINIFDKDHFEVLDL